MDRRLVLALTAAGAVALGVAAWLLDPADDKARLARVDETVGIGDVVFGAPPPPGFKPTRTRGMVVVWRGTTTWDEPPHQRLEAALTAYDGRVGRVTVFPAATGEARRMRQDLQARLGEPTKRREKAGGIGDRWIGRHVFVSYDEREGQPGGRVRMVDTRYARHVDFDDVDPLREAEVLPRE